MPRFLPAALAVALAPEVRVNAVAPGLVATRWFRRAVGEERAAQMEQAYAESSALMTDIHPEAGEEGDGLGVAPASFA